MNKCGFGLLREPRPLRLRHVPPLSIAYIMIATAITGLVLTVLNELLSSDDRRVVSRVLVLGGLATVFGWIYTALLLVAWHAVRKTLWQLEPGEWLLICTGNLATVWIGASILGAIIDCGYHLLSRDSIQFYGALVLPGEMATSYILAAWMQRRQKWWCSAMLAAVVLFASPYVAKGLNPFPVRSFLLFLLLTTSVIVLLLTASVVTDCRRRESRHWIHWSGVAISVLAAMASTVVLSLALYFHW